MVERRTCAQERPGSRMSLRIAALVVVCSLPLALAGCRTTPIGEPRTIRIPANLSEREAQDLVTDYIENGGKSTAPGRSRPATRKLRGIWQIEQWEPGFLVATYAWRSHVLRVRIEFADRTVRLAIGRSENLRQSADRIHKSAKAMTRELGDAIQYQFAESALSPRRQSEVASRSLQSKPSSFCTSTWEGDPQEQASCRRAQRRSYDRLLPVISKAKAIPTDVESKKLQACYARTQTWAGADWEAIERCFYSPPASAR
jgi:hypothetical protein